MKLYSHHIGSHALDCTVPDNDGSPVDAVASIAEDGKTAYLHLVNTDRIASRNISLEIPSQTITGVTAFEIAHDPMEEITPLTPELFRPVEKAVEGTTYTLPAAGVAALEIKLW